MYIQKSRWHNNWHFVSVFRGDYNFVYRMNETAFLPNQHDYVTVFDKRRRTKVDTTTHMVCMNIQFHALVCKTSKVLNCSA